MKKLIELINKINQELKELSNIMTYEGDKIGPRNYSYIQDILNAIKYLKKEIKKEISSNKGDKDEKTDT